MKQQLYIFDFDGTLTKHDTFLPFAKHVVGRKKLAAVLLRHIHLLIGMKIHLADNGKVKEQIITALFKNRTQQEMDTYCRQFAEKSRSVLPRPIQFLRYSILFSSILRKSGSPLS